MIIVGDERIFVCLSEGYKWASSCDVGEGGDIVQRSWTNGCSSVQVVYTCYC